MEEQLERYVSSNGNSNSNSERTTRVEVGRWIDVDESAKEMLSRIFIERPFRISLPPPLHRLPFRLGNVIEIFGPSPSAKTHILIQAAINFILPKEWNGIYYGGLNQLVMFVDLDCRFDILRVSEMLKHRIMKYEGELNNNLYDEALYDLCMRRFLYVRCSNSFEFLAILKTLHYRLQKEKEVHGLSAHLLLIDSIGAFHWIDRATTVLPIRENNRRGTFLQYVSETIVREIKKLLEVHPMLVIATKSCISGDKNISALNHQMKGDLPNVFGNCQQFVYRDYMPSAWQSFVTHRLLVRASDNHFKGSEPSQPLYLSEWLLPLVNYSDKFVVKEAGVLLVT